MGWAIFYGALMAAGALILVANPDSIVALLIGAPLFVIGLICFAVQLLLG